METCPAEVDCDQMPREVFYEDDGFPSDNNDIDDKRMTLFNSLAPGRFDNNFQMSFLN